MEEQVKEVIAMDEKGTDEDVPYMANNEDGQNLPNKDSSTVLIAASAEQTEKCEADSNSKDDHDENHVCMDTEDQEILKEGTILLQGSNRILQITAKHLKLDFPSDQPTKKKKKNGEAFEIPWQHVICAKINTKVSEELHKTSFTVHYMQKHKRKLRTHCMNLSTLEGTSDDWIGIIQEQCAKVEGRPKRVLVVINPIGGAGTGRQLYQRKVSPILQLAQVHADVFYTERSKHALEIVDTQDVFSYDAVIVVGGDGLYQEVLQAMAVKKQKVAGVDYDNVNAKFAGLNTPVAIIAGGTGNGVAGFANLTKDIETAALRILTGETHRSQIFTVHSNGKFFCVCGLLFGYGTFSDLIKRTEELRWMRRARYPYCLLAHLVKKKRRSRFMIEYCLAPDSQKSGNDKLSGNVSNPELQTDQHWIRHDGQGKDYLGTFSFVANPTDKGDHTAVDIFTDRFRLFVDSGCATLSLGKTLIYMISGRKMESFPQNLDVFENVQGVRVKLMREEGEKDEELTGAMAKTRALEMNIDIDGECLQLEVPEFDLRVVPSFVPLYSCKLE